MNFRRKVGMGWPLCLSSFYIACAIFRAVGHNLVNGRDDVVWILFWSHIEACVALIAYSMTAFRGLFKINGSRGERPVIQEKKRSMHIGSLSKGSGQTAQVEIPSATKPELSGLRSILMWGPFEDREHGDFEGTVVEEAEHAWFRDDSVVSSNVSNVLEA